MFVQEWVAALMGRAGRLAPQLDPAAAAGLLASAGHLGAAPPLRLVAAAVEGTLQQLQQQGGSAGTGSATGVPQQQQQQQQQEEGGQAEVSSSAPITPSVATTASGVGVSEASLLLWALHRASLVSSQVGGWVRGNQAQLQQLVAATQPMLPGAQPLELRRLATAVAGLGCSPGGVWWAAHQAAVVLLLPHMRPEGLAEVAAAYQQVRHPLQPQLQPYVAASAAQGPGTQHQQQQRQQQGQGQRRLQQEGGAALRSAPALLRPGATHRPSSQHMKREADAGR
jgi:hypothetical protein